MVDRFVLALVLVMAATVPARAEPISALVAFLGTTAFTVGGTAITVGAVINAALVVASVASALISTFNTPKGRPPVSALENRFDTDVSTTVAAEIGDRITVRGRARNGGNLLQYEARDTVVYRAQALHHGRMQGIDGWVYGDRILAVDANGWVTTEPFNQSPPPGRQSNMRLRFVNGAAGQAAFADWVAALAPVGSTPAAWDANSRGEGIGIVFGEYTGSSKAVFQSQFPSGVENLAPVVEGEHVLDVRTNVTAFSRLAALHVYDLLRSPDGARMPVAALDVASFRHAADLDDQNVTTRSGDIIDRWSVDVADKLTDELADRLRVLLEARDGRLVEGPQGLALLGGRWREPTITIGPSDIIAITSSTRGTARMSLANTFVPTMVWPANNYIQTAFENVIVSDSVARVGPYVDPFFPRAVSHQNQLYRLMKLRAQRKNPARRLQLVLDYFAGIRLLAEIHPDDPDGVPRQATTVRLAPFPGRDIAGTYEIVGAPRLDPASRRVEITIISLSAAAYAFDAATEERLPPPIAVDTRQQGGLPGAAIVSATVASTTITVTVESPGRSDLALEARVRAFGAPAWDTPTFTAATAALSIALTSQPTGTREVQLRFTASGGRIGPWSVSITRTV